MLAGHRRARRGRNPRVEALVASTDGFELAEVDLDLRGEGTIMNTAQKGRSDLKLASLRRDRELVLLAREAAFEIVDADPRLSTHPVLLDELRLLLPEERGVPLQELGEKCGWHATPPPGVGVPAIGFPTSPNMRKLSINLRLRPWSQQRRVYANSHRGGREGNEAFREGP